MGTDNFTENNTPPQTPEHPQQQPISVDKPRPHVKKPLIDYFRNTSHEIGVIKKELQDLPEPQSEKPEIPKTPEPKLFSNKPTLYDKYHEKYQRERKTPTGFIERLFDIRSLKKQGIKDAKNFYDAMRSRGYYSDEIVNESKLVENLGCDLSQLPKNIDRLHLIGVYSPDHYNICITFKSNDDTVTREPTWYEDYNNVSSLTDETFNKTINQLDSYYFLKNILNYDSHLKSEIFREDFSLSLTSKNILDAIKDLYQNTPMKKDSDDQTIQIDDRFLSHIFLDNEISQYSLENNIIGFYEKYLENSKKDETPIIIPESIKTILPKHKELFNKINNFNDSNRQKYCLSLYSKTYNPKEIDVLFDNNNLAISKFYLKYYSDQDNQDLEITKPENFSNFSDRDKIFWTKVISTDKSERNQLIEFGVNINFNLFTEAETNEIKQYRDNPANDFNNRKDNFFTADGNPTVEFYFVFQKFKPTEQIISNFSKEDQKLWNCMPNIEGFDKRWVIGKLILYLEENKIDDYFDQNNKPTSLFLKTYLAGNAGQISKGNYLQITLTPELIETFDEKDQKLWNCILGVKGSDKYEVTRFIASSLDKDKIDDYFDKNNQPTDLFFITYINSKYQKNIFSDFFKEGSFLQTTLTPELIKTFNQTDQKFWEMAKNRFAVDDKNKKICNQETFKKIFQEKNKIITNVSDVSFIDGLFGQFEKRSNDIIQNYIDCINSGVITPKDKNLITDFLKEFRIISPAIINQYKEAKLSNNESVFISYLKEITGKMSSAQPLTETDRQKPFYKDLIKHVYSNNAGSYASYESNESCADRSSDISQFSIQKKYQIDLLSQSQITVKKGIVLDKNVQSEVQKPIYKVQEQLKDLGFDKNRCNDELSTKINEQLAKLKASEIINEIKLDNIKLPEDQLFILLAEAVYGNGLIDINTVKELMIAYEFINYEDVKDYINGTNDRVSTANNQDYALLCELDTFYSDKIKDINKRIIETALKNEDIVDILPKYFKKLNQVQTNQNNQSSINKIQIDKLGLSQNFLEQITKTLNRRSGGKKTYSPEQAKKILERYESFTHGLSTSSSTSKNKNTQAFYGQVRSQREKTFSAANNFSQEIFNPQDIHLGEINLRQLLETQNNIQTGQYNQEQFTAFTAQKFMDIFSQEKLQIETELDKFVSESGKDRENLNGYITKTKESANARMVGGVCVSGDNPDSTKEGNMWNTPEYFQFIFQDPETLQCQGLVLMHHYIENGKKVLTVSLNPSSTYLYSVDEKALFQGILNQIEIFASTNKFDLITVSQNKTIRTNRTGGEFEKAIDEKVKTVGKTFKFAEPKTFSYKPSYKIQDMDVIWENKNPTK